MPSEWNKIPGMTAAAARRNRTGGRRPAGAGLSREIILAAAVGLLDESGVAGCTFREMSVRLKTGAGAIYWHVSDKDELVRGAADAVLDGISVTATGADAVREGALAVFDAVAAHSWVSAAAERDEDVPALANIAAAIRAAVEGAGHTGPRSRSAVASAIALALRLGAQAPRDPFARATLLEGVDLIAAGLVERTTVRTPARSGLSVRFVSRG